LIRVGLQKHIVTLRKKPSATEKAELFERRRRLILRITSFERKGNACFKLDDDVRWMTDVNGEGEEEEDSHYSDESDVEDVPEDMPETRAWPYPHHWLPVRLSSWDWLTSRGRNLHCVRDKSMMRSKDCEWPWERSPFYTGQRSGI
jgi:hypothetical protein